LAAPETARSPLRARHYQQRRRSISELARLHGEYRGIGDSLAAGSPTVPLGRLPVNSPSDEIGLRSLAIDEFSPCCASRRQPMHRRTPDPSSSMVDSDEDQRRQSFTANSVTIVDRRKCASQPAFRRRYVTVHVTISDAVIEDNTFGARWSKVPWLRCNASTQSCLASRVPCNSDDGTQRQSAWKAPGPSAAPRPVVGTKPLSRSVRTIGVAARQPNVLPRPFKAQGVRNAGVVDAQRVPAHLRLDRVTP
jgi:hypothetical protein